ncbi:type IV pilus secretin PilQ subfamily [Candidatus Nitrosoglobus terrae]|uniref:Type IV pilus secretin PilQ subfamily n=1 Tax=Candidatus Nitrosoglobus terrae TaxID=1630141 RepID=A0A1Q2SPU4_9GAMM|nr:type IV pilus secretin PilQ subfamily [Candidatus Nitrosoglobus terrae]
MLLPRTVLAITELQDIKYSLLSGDRVQIRLEFSGAMPNPKSFTIDEPARIVLDFPGIKIGAMSKSQLIGLGVAHSLTMAQAADRVRIVVNLVRSVPFKTQIKKNTIYVTINGFSKSGTVANAKRHLLKNIDFRRGENGEGQVVISLSDTQIPVDIREENSQIIVDFNNTTLPRDLERRLDVLDFATPIKFIDAAAEGQNTRIVIIPTSAEYKYLSYQSENTLVVELKPQITQNKGLVNENKPGYTGKELSLNFQNIEVRSVLQLLADFSEFNLVTTDSVQGNITLRLKRVPWDQALDIILKTKGLAMRRTDNILLIAPSEEIAAREEQELKAKKQMEELAPLRSEFIQLNFAKASALANIIQGGGNFESENTANSGQGLQSSWGGGGSQGGGGYLGGGGFQGSGGGSNNSFLSPRGKLTIDDRTNTLLIMDTPDKIAEIRKLIVQLDVPVHQVLIESRIVIATTTFSKELGVRFGVTETGSQPISSGSLEATNQIINGTQSTQDPLKNQLNVNLPVTQADAARAAIAFTKLPYGTLLELELSALQAEGRGKVISNPRVITSNNKEALIEQGTEIPYQQAASSGATSVSFKKAVLSLKVVPQITPDNRVIMDLMVNQDTVGTVFNGVPSINTRQLSTRVLVDNGQTVVLGGIYEQEQNQNRSMVPFLGKLPYVGALFRSRTEENNKSELLIFVTPKIVKEET